jgi:hypothetical protein
MPETLHYRPVFKHFRPRNEGEFFARPVIFDFRCRTFFKIQNQINHFFTDKQSESPPMRHDSHLTSQGCAQNYYYVTALSII